MLVELLVPLLDEPHRPPMRHPPNARTNDGANKVSQAYTPKRETETVYKVLWQDSTHRNTYLRILGSQRHTQTWGQCSGDKVSAAGALVTRAHDTHEDGLVGIHFHIAKVRHPAGKAPDGRRYRDRLQSQAKART